MCKQIKILIIIVIILLLIYYFYENNNKEHYVKKVLDMMYLLSSSMKYGNNPKISELKKTKTTSTPLYFYPVCPPIF